jgi:hypothetical protein
VKPFQGRGVIPALRLGSIVRAPIVPDGGDIKDRRCVVIAPPSKDPTEPIWVVGVTSDGGDYDPSDQHRYHPALFIPMPHAEDGSCRTTFTIPCAAKATWVQHFDRTELEITRGCLEGDDLQELLDKLDAYAMMDDPPE